MIKYSLSLLKNMTEMSNKMFEDMLEDAPDWMRHNLNHLIVLNNKILTELNKENPDLTYINILAKIIKSKANQLNEINISKN